MKVPLDILPEDQLPEVILELAQRPERKTIVFLHYRQFMKARRDAEYLGFLQRAALVIPVSKSLDRACRFLHLTQPFRYHPFDFVIKMLGILEQKGMSYYLFGDRIASVQKIAANMRASFPKLNLVGRHVGYYPKETEETILTATQKATPHVILIGPGVPGKERWSFRHAGDLPPSLSVWSGETFQIASGARPRPSKDEFRKGTHELSAAFRNPLKWPRLFSYLWFGILMLVYKMRK